jgi:DNA-directed RNA polymerase I, II, and III subunit RPABC2
MMSSGIPSLPKKQLLHGEAAADADSENEDAPVIQDDDSDAESGAAGSEINEETDDDNSTTAGTLTSDEEDESEDDTGAATGTGEGTGARAGADDSGDEGDDDGGQGYEDDDTVAVAKNKKKRAAAALTSGRKRNMEDDMTLLGVPHGIQFDDDDDEDESSDEDIEYFQKLKRSVHESYIDTYHPESMSHNYDEIQTLARVVRNNAGVIVDDLHRTIPIMTKYEKTRILGQRAKQLNEGSPAFIKIDSTVIDGYLIAVKELEQKKTPFIIRRPLPNGGSEYWRVQDLEIL